MQAPVTAWWQYSFLGRRLLFVFTHQFIFSQHLFPLSLTITGSTSSRPLSVLFCHPYFMSWSRRLAVAAVLHYGAACCSVLHRACR